MGAAKRSEILQPGQRAPDFKLGRMDNGSRTLQELLCGRAGSVGIFQEHLSGMPDDAAVP